MSFDDVQTEVLQHMLRVYAPPKTFDAGEQDEVLGNYLIVLQDFTKTQLHAGWKAVLASWTRTTWPPPAVIVLACRRAISERANEARHALSATGKAAAEREWFDRACERHGLNPAVMARPNLWWLQPRDLWRPEWREDEVPKGERPNRRTLAQQLAAHGKTEQPVQPVQPLPFPNVLPPEDGR